MRRLLAALLLALPAAPHSLAAQDATQAWLLTPGARVRVTYPGSEGRVGTLVALTADTVELQWADRTDTARFARAGMSRLAVSRGVQHRDRAGSARTGFLIGAGIGVLVGVTDSGSEPGCAGSEACNDAITGLVTVIGATMFGTVGALIGAVSARTTEKWETIRLAQPRLNVVMPSAGRGAGVGVGMTF
jgi:hypothetical protein